MSHILDEITIKLHTAANGDIWYARGIAPATNSEQTLHSFLLSPPANGMGLIFRLLGVVENAELITALYLRKNKGEARAIQVAGPHHLRSTERADPAATLFKLRTIHAAPACGGWHSLSFYDYATYALLARMERNKSMLDEAANNYLKIHPIYAAASFIPTLNPLATAQLLTTIVDPRWFVDVRAPDNPSKLQLYLGLMPAIQRRVSDTGALLTRRREIRCANVLACWRPDDMAAVDMHNPANFLARAWQAAGGGVRGDLRASQLFIRYICQNWLVGLEQRRGPRDGLFAPNLFFKSPAEMTAYTAHMLAPGHERLP
jgi:hypothetical protein